MATQSIIRLSKKMSPEDIELAAKGVNDRRFQGRMNIETVEGFNTEVLEQMWVFYAPDTRPKKPTLIRPDGNLGFMFWLRKDEPTVEVRHVVLNPWIRWVQDVFKHELARALDVERFDCGDGMTRANPEIYKGSLREYAISNLSNPLSPLDQKFLKRYFMASIPEGWE